NSMSFTIFLTVVSSFTVSQPTELYTLSLHAALPISLVRRGDRKAKTVQTALQDLYRQLSAAQLGITVASILLGYELAVEILQRRDRKSTRLNSSHVAISYAVFCLKKKK